MANLKMVKGQSYSCPAVFGDRVVARGEVVEVSDEHAAHLLAASYFDASNNEHHYFAETDDAPGLPAAGTPTPAKKAAKAEPASRRRAASAE